MPVVEITQLRLKGVAVDDPALLESLSLVRGKLQTNSRFFSCIEDSSLIYIFGVWPSLDAHLKFLASPARDEILGPQEELLDFQWTIHLELSTASPILIDAPFIAIERLDFNGGHTDVYNKTIKEHVQNLQPTDLLRVTHGWRCDTPIGSHEAVILTSSSSAGLDDTEVGSHVTLSRHDGDRPYCKILFHRAWNMEHMQFGS